MMQGNQLVAIPRQFKFSTVPEFDLSSSLKFRNQSPAQRRAIAPENMPSLEKTVFAVTGSAQVQPTRSKSAKWMPRGTGNAPTATNAPTTLINEVVPQGYNFWIEQAAFQLFDTNEFDYQWCVFVNGVDILNFGSTTNFPGRPVIDPRAFSMGTDRASQVMVPPGGKIQVVVISLTGAPGGNPIAATLIGNLEGVIE